MSGVLDMLFGTAGSAPVVPLSGFTLVGSGVVTMSANPSIITTTALVPANALIIVGYWIDSGGLGTVVVNSVTDTNSDTYAAVGSNINNAANPHVAMNAFTGLCAAGMASSSQIKLTTSATSGGSLFVFVGYMTGATGVDAHVGGPISGTTFVSQSTGTLTHSPSLAIGLNAARGSISPPGAFSAASGFTLVSPQLTGGNDRVAMQIQTTQSAGTGSVTFAPPGGSNVTGDMLFTIY